MTDHAASDPVGGQRVEAASVVLDAYQTMALSICDDDGPWIARAFFVQDEPASGRLDVCCSLLLNADRRAAFERSPRVAFIIGGETPDRWVTGRGTAEAVADQADADAIVKRLRERGEAASLFLDRPDQLPVRIHVERLTITEPASDQPVTEFTFA